MRRARRLYLPRLDRASRHRHAVVLAAVVLAGAAGYAATRMGGEFIPSLDEGDVALAAIRIPGTSLSLSIELQKALEKLIRQIQEVKEFFTRIGTSEVA